MFEATSRDGQGQLYFDPEATRTRFLIGTVEDVAEAIRTRTAGLPVTALFGWSDNPGLPDAAVERHIELTFTQLAPLLARG